MPSIASAATGLTPSTQGSTSASPHPSFRKGAAGTSVDGRSRAPEAARPQGARATVVGRTSTEAPGLTPPMDGGLVICAENVRDPLLDGIATGELRAIDALGLRFPSPEMVTAAAALFEPAAAWACGPGRRGTAPESGRFRITVGPGVVRLGWTNPVRAEKTAERAVGHHQRDVDDAMLHVRNDMALAAGDGDQSVVSSTRRSPTENNQHGTGGVITEWSRKSRSAMCRTYDLWIVAGRFAIGICKQAPRRTALGLTSTCAATVLGRTLCVGGLALGYIGQTNCSSLGRVGKIRCLIFGYGGPL